MDKELKHKLGHLYELSAMEMMQAAAAAIRTIEELEYKLEHPDMSAGIKMQQDPIAGGYVPVDVCLYNSDEVVDDVETCDETCERYSSDCECCVISKVFNHYAELTHQTIRGTNENTKNKP